MPTSILDPKEIQHELDNLMLIRVQVETQLLQKEQQLFSTKLGQEVMALSNAKAKNEERLRQLLDQVQGVVDTAWGKVGFQPRTKYTYNPAAIQEVLPQYVELVVHPMVDAAALKKLLPAKDGRWKLLNEHSSTLAKHEKAWQCKLLNG